MSQEGSIQSQDPSSRISVNNNEETTNDLKLKSTPQSPALADTITPKSDHENNSIASNSIPKNKFKIPITIPEIVTSIGWVLAIVFCIWYVVNASGEFQTSQNNPTTALSIVEKVPLELPAVTICNWNGYYECDFCDLTLKTATRVVDGNVVEFEIPYEYKEIEQNGLYRCYVFNNFSDQVMTSNATGYGGVISLFFDVPSVPQERDARFGLQVSFHEIGTIPNVFAETNFAVANVDNYFVLTKIVTTRLKPSIENPNLTDTRWESILSLVELTQRDDNTVVISFTYNTLTEHNNAEMYTSSIEGLLGEIAGILGVMMGIDILKMLRGCLQVPYSFKHKSIRGIWDTFN
ncbi:hypothetical protein C9374_012982 [Naegleria lovaniensis]|uniref:Uncharacterized protein n=1 Tax=Naegleria lovaniensis TaxID=51637 RepID=A0AA88KHK1_NAELO|nr:uncharacterized protein C9374_012982 [Naegleria lovaniensis]KAG2372952.1 hypothetical protein C9374_012982 [Naegleria lovaniensis]